MNKITLDDLIKQAQTIDALLSRSFRLHRDGDRVPYVIQGRASFQVGATQTTEMVFNVPTDADFEGEYMNLYLESRIVSLDTTQRQSEKTFRPADWFHASSPFIVDGKAGCLFELRDSINGAYQNVAMAIPSAFSAAVCAPLGSGAGSGFFNARGNAGIPQYPGALAFHVPYQLKRGSTLTCRITPVQTSPVSIVEDYETLEFEVRGLIHGYKRTYGFK
jgi:hypothetical protein